MKRRVAILISGRGSNMAALIEAAKAVDFPAEIVTVISNRADAGGLEKAAASGIATTVIESKPFGKDRAGFEAMLQRALDERNVELICLGGFMRLFTAEFVQRWYGRMLNVHRSLLPWFPGLDPHGHAPMTTRRRRCRSASLASSTASTPRRCACLPKAGCASRATSARFREIPRRTAA